MSAPIIPIFAWFFPLGVLLASTVGSAHAARRLRAALALPAPLRRRLLALTVWDALTGLLLLAHTALAAVMAATLWRPVPAWLTAFLLVPGILLAAGVVVVPRWLRRLHAVATAGPPRLLPPGAAARAAADRAAVVLHRVLPPAASLLAVLMVNKPSTGPTVLLTGLLVVACALVWRHSDGSSGIPAARRPAGVGARLAAAAGVIGVVAAWGTWSQAASHPPDRFGMMEFHEQAHSGHASGGSIAAATSTAARHQQRVAQLASDTAQLDVSKLRGPETVADGTVRRHTLTAQPARIRLASGSRVDAWTYNGTAPGPELRVRQGDLVEVRLVNRLPEPTTIHWHGVDVRNGEDGVAGVTQEAVRPGDSFTYRFVAEDTGTYWYHAHQAPHTQVGRGLFGKLTVLPRDGEVADVDVTVAAHTWTTTGGDTVLALDAADTLTRRQVTPGASVRLRVVNTDNQPLHVQLRGAGFTVAALDGQDLHQPTPLEAAIVPVAAGGRADLGFTMPDGPVALTPVSQSQARRPIAAELLLSPDAQGAPPPDQAGDVFDVTGYGSPDPTQDGTGLTTDGPFDRVYHDDIDERLGFFDGAFRWSFPINGKLFPYGDMHLVRPGDRVKIVIRNRSSNTHPMHLHGHHFTVLARNGQPLTGSPVVLDTLDIAPGETWEIAFVADNPGLWMDHCHNQDHAANGMDLMVVYEGVTTPFQAGDATGNHPE